MASVTRVSKYLLKSDSHEETVERLLCQFPMVYFDAYRRTIQEPSIGKDGIEVQLLSGINPGANININAYKTYRYVGNGLYVITTKESDDTVPSPRSQLWTLGILSSRHHDKLGITYEIQSKIDLIDNKHERYLIVFHHPDLEVDNDILEKFIVEKDLTLDPAFVNLLPLSWI